MNNDKEKFIENSIIKHNILETHRGSHIMIDYYKLQIYDANKFANFVFSLMKDIISIYSSMTIVHSHLHIFNPLLTNPGFTSVLLLDESHFSAHCYSDDGLLAIDLFTCGITDTKTLITLFHNKLLENYPDAEFKILHTLERF